MKAVVKILNASPNAKFIGGFVDYTAMFPHEIEAYSKLPSLRRQHEELVGLLSQPSQTLLRLLSTNQTNLTQALGAYIQQNEPDTGGGEGGAQGEEG